jgi:WD40 repeat protein
MASLFISHSSQDRATAEWIRDRLEAAGFAALFLSFDPMQGIPAGHDWERELYGQLRKTDGVIFLASRASVASQWCFAEVSLARSLGRRVFPLRIDSQAGLPLLADVQGIDLSEGESAITRLVAGLRQAGLDPTDAFGWDANRCPYPGLEAFSPEDAAVFFGRDREIARLLELLHPSLQRGAGRFIAIVGPSGSGKSSLLRAGLLPRLRRLENTWFVLRPVRPGQRPTHNLARSLSQAFAAHGHARSVGEVEAGLGADGSGLAELATELAEITEDTRNILVVIDQAEELVTRSGVAEQEAFLRLLSNALGEDCPLWAVATMRSEFLSVAPERAGLAKVIDATLMIEPLGRTHLPEVILRPAQRAGLEFTPGLVERMADETHGRDALSLLAYTLRELYERAGGSGVITTTDYEAFGGVIGAMQRRADLVLDELTRRGLGSSVLPTLLKLAAIDQEGAVTSRRVPLRTLDTDDKAVISAFVEARLLTSGSDVDEEPMVEVAHEALLRQWPPLHQAIESARTSLRMRTELERLALDWSRRGKDDSYLLRGGRLAAFDAWTGEEVASVGPLEGQFLDASRALASRELAAARRSNRRLRALTAALAVFLITTLTVSALAYQRNQRVQLQTRHALSRQLAGQAERLVTSEPDVAILVGLQALSLARDEPGSQPSTGLVTGLARLNHASMLFDGHNDGVYAVAFSPDGSRLASVSWDETVRVWDAATGKQVGASLRGHSGGVNSVAFSPDGTQLVSGGEDGTLRLWSLTTHQQQGTSIPGHTGAVNGVAFSQDGKRLASAGGDGTVRLWDPQTRQLLGVLRGHTRGVWAVAFSRDGKQLVSGDDAGIVRVWSAANRAPLRPALHGATDAVQSVAFSPDGREVAAASLDGKVHRYAISATPTDRPITVNPKGLRGVAYSPDGKMLATGGADKSVRLFDAASGQELGFPLAIHTSDVRSVTFSPDSTQVLSGGWDADVRLSRVATTYSISRPLPVHYPNAIFDVSFSPDEQQLAVASADGRADLFQMHGGPIRRRQLVVLADEVNRVVWSRDGGLITVAGADGTVTLLNASTRKEIWQLTEAEGAVFGAAVDRKILATAGENGVIRLRQLATGQDQGRLPVDNQEVVNAVTFSPDGAWLATAGDDQKARIYRVTDRRQVHELKAHTNAVTAIAFSPDGGLLVTGGADGQVLFWDPRSGRQLGKSLTRQVGEINALAFSRDGESLATGASDGTVRVWNVASRRETRNFTGHMGAVWAVSFSPDGEQLASAGEDGNVLLWRPRFSAWVADGCKIVNRNLSMQEWERLLPGLPYTRTCPALPSGRGAPTGAPVARY